MFIIQLHAGNNFLSGWHPTRWFLEKALDWWSCCWATGFCWGTHYRGSFRTQPNLRSHDADHCALRWFFALIKSQNEIASRFYGGEKKKHACCNTHLHCRKQGHTIFFPHVCLNSISRITQRFRLPSQVDTFFFQRAFFIRPHTPNDWTITLRWKGFPCLNADDEYGRGRGPGRGLFSRSVSYLGIL